MLPWQVCQELDCIKKQDNQLGFRAREATRWMLNIISKKHPRLKGQPMTIKKGESNDDAILMCAISLKDRVQHVVRSFIFSLYYTYIVCPINMITLKIHFSFIII